VIEMLQNGTTVPTIVIDWNTIIGFIVGLIVSVIVLSIELFLLRKWDVDKENRRKEEESNRIKQALISELEDNLAIIMSYRLVLRREDTKRV
jgi:phosphotransferase system  glucose/maltose/N-acetylglucosamine-specific IIC component